MKTINIITYGNQDIELTFNKDEVFWTVERDGKKYGKGAIFPDRKLNTIVGVVGTIILNAVETIQLLDKEPKQCKPQTSLKVSKKNSKSS